MPTNPDRAAIFERAIAEWDPKMLKEALDFAMHRFVSIERDALTGERYARGHKSMRGACSHMARAIEEGDRYVPENVIDLDTGELHELDVFAFVAPKSVNAVALLLPLVSAELIEKALWKFPFGAPLQQLHDSTIKLVQQALARRR